MIAKHISDITQTLIAGHASKTTAATGIYNPVAVYDQRILRSLRHIIHGVEQYSSQLASSWKITAPQLICLMEIANYGPMNATCISRAVHLSPSTVVGIIDRLEEKGWVKRVRDIKDRRVIVVSATAAGKKLLEQAPSPLQQTLADALSNLPEQEQSMIAESLERVVVLMQAPEIDVAPILASGSGIPTEL